MERLTQEADFGLEDWEETLFLVKSDPNGAYNILDIARYEGEQEFDEILINIALRLAEIENILGDDYNCGLLSELVTAYKEGRYIIMRDAEQKGVARLLELSEADRDGRCKVLPCKDWMEIVFGDQDVFYGIDTDYLECPIREISVDSSSRCTWYDGWKTVVLKGYDENGFDWEFSPEDIGKRVFLTREAAEAALKGEQDGSKG